LPNLLLTSADISSFFLAKLKKCLISGAAKKNKKKQTMSDIYGTEEKPICFLSDDSDDDTNNCARARGSSNDGLASRMGLPPAVVTPQQVISRTDAMDEGGGTPTGQCASPAEEEPLRAEEGRGATTRQSFNREVETLRQSEEGGYSPTEQSSTPRVLRTRTEEKKATGEGEGTDKAKEQEGWGAPTRRSFNREVMGRQSEEEGCSPTTQSSNPRGKQPSWTDEKLNLLASLVSTHGKKWKKIKKYFPGHSERSCSVAHFHHCNRENKKDSRHWTPEEMRDFRKFNSFAFSSMRQ
jgi:hypothetical protein